MRANVYIDGFNLYNRAVKHRPELKWLDVRRMCELMFRDLDICHIRYFTADLHATKEDPEVTVRQQMYLRALATIPGLSIHKGAFRLYKKKRRLLRPIPGLPAEVIVLQPEEKGSDVNLATYLLLDAFDGACDVAIVFTNDTDQKEPIRLVRERFGLEVIVVNPTLSGIDVEETDNPAETEHFKKKNRDKQRASELQSVASKVRPLRRGVLAASQFPDVLQDENGEIRRPHKWSLSYLAPEGTRVSV